jgi:hypothetical protein
MTEALDKTSGSVIWATRWQIPSITNHKLNSVLVMYQKPSQEHLFKPHFSLSMAL